MKIRGNTVSTTVSPEILRDKLSPTITVTAIAGGNRVTITDKNGTKSFDVMDGKDGADGTGGSAELTFSDDGNGNVTIGTNAASGSVKFTDKGDGNIVLEVM